ncbi:hypothetical protein ACF0H5_022767 [Mactra antiquata]
MWSVLKFLSSIRNILIVILTPILLLPVTLSIPGQESSCAYVVIIMAVFWITEALPLNVTALLPIFMFPMVGVLSAGAVAKVFFTSTSLMFLGGMAVGVAIEEWDIHKRIALKILLLLGARPVWLMLGLMLTAWFLSMWISNTATVAMMLPIAMAILQQLKENTKLKQSTNVDGTDEHLISSQNGNVKGDIELTDLNDIEKNCAPREINGKTRVDEDNNEMTQDESKESAEWTRISKALCLCIAYAANVGGTASMTGSTPNLVLKGQLDTVYKDLDSKNPLTFSKWLAFGIPTSFVIVILSWLWLQVYFLRCRGWSGCRKSEEEDDIAIRSILRAEYAKLGPFTFAQVSVLMHLILIALLWITRDMGGTIGWAGLFEDDFIKDSVPAVFVACLLFIFPSQIPSLQTGTEESTPIKPLLSWKVFNAKMPWGVVLLLGGGFAMAKASQESGLSAWIGSQLMGLSHLDPWLLNLVICFIVAAATEVTSNTATTSLMLPIIAELSLKIGLDPLYLMYPISFAASFAFMLPVATPPNVVVFSSGYVRVIDMIKAGFVLNIIAVGVLVVFNEYLREALFGSKFL